MTGGRIFALAFCASAGAACGLITMAVLARILAILLLGIHQL